MKNFSQRFKWWGPKVRHHPVVDLFTWRPRTGSLNFGDELSVVVANQVLASRGFGLSDEVRTPVQLLTVGSVLHFASNDAVVWGTGVNGKVDPRLHRFDRLDVRAVRGPRTYEWLKGRGIACPEVFGDPALLLPKFRRVERASDPRGAIFIPNLNDIELMKKIDINGSVEVISPLSSWNRILETICRSELVLSSSLHGLILAESYGIPARYVRLTELENMFKFNDYFEGTGRFNYIFARSIEEGLEMGGAEPLYFDGSKLMDAFPFDIWEKPLD